MKTPKAKFRPDPDLIAGEKPSPAELTEKFALFAKNLGILDLAVRTSSNETARQILKYVNAAAQCALRGEDFNPLKST